MTSLVKIGLLTMALAVIFMQPALVQGAPLTVNITATITLINDPFNLLGGNFSVGDTISGHYTYELTTPDTNPQANIGYYYNYTAPSGMYLVCNGFGFNTDPSNVKFLVAPADNNPVTDYLIFISYENKFDIPSLQNLIEWRLRDPTGTALSGTALPTGPPNLAAWNSNSFDISGRDASSFDYLIRATVTSATVVPLPGAALLLGSGLLWLYAVRRRLN